MSGKNGKFYSSEDSQTMPSPTRKGTE